MVSLILRHVTRAFSPEAACVSSDCIGELALAFVHDYSLVHVFVNNPPSVNISTSSPALEAAFAERLRSLLAEIGWLPDGEIRPDETANPGYDLLATLHLPGGGHAALCIECKRELRPAAFPALAARVFSPPGQPRVIVPILALPSVSPRIAELCAEHGWSWFDLAGNCRLDVPGLLHIAHTGNAPVHTVPRPSATLASPEAARVIRALLDPRHVNYAWTQRDLQLHCQPVVSLGLVNKLVRHLRDEAYLIETSAGLRVSDPQKLLFAWRDAYRFDRHERRSYFTLLSGKRLRDALYQFENISDGHAAYASFSAADFQAPHVRQPKTWLYVRPQDLARFAALTEAKPVDSGENLVVLPPADEGVFYVGAETLMSDGLLRCTHPVQTYVDLWHSGGRGQEAAEALLEHVLLRAWKLREVKP